LGRKKKRNVGAGRAGVERQGRGYGGRNEQKDGEAKKEGSNG